MLKTLWTSYWTRYGETVLRAVLYCLRETVLMLVFLLF